MISFISIDDINILSDDYRTELTYRLDIILNMTNILDVSLLYNTYIDAFPSDKTNLQLLDSQLALRNEDILSRKNFTGHITASAFIIDHQTHQVLLLEHKVLKKLLQPGGHVDREDRTILSAALRETTEETGLKSEELTLQPVLQSNVEVPIHIDTHYIPANPNKDEPDHYHHDFRYLFLTEKSDINVNLLESNGFKWINWASFRKDKKFEAVANRIDNILK